MGRAHGRRDGAAHRAEAPLAPGVGHRRRGRRRSCCRFTRAASASPASSCRTGSRRGRGPRSPGGARPPRAARLRALRRSGRPRHGPAPGLVDLAGRGRRRRARRDCSRSTSSCSRGSTRSRSTPRRRPASTIPTDSAATGLAFLRRMQAGHDRAMQGQPARPDRGVPAPLAGRARAGGPARQARFITYDSFQFMFADGRITGLLDFEHAHVGDPMMDLAALRIRDTLKIARRSRRDRLRATRR